MTSVLVHFKKYYKDKKCETVEWTVKTRENPNISARKLVLPNTNDWSTIMRNCSNDEYLFMFETYGQKQLVVLVYGMFESRLVRLQHIHLPSLIICGIEDCFIGENEHFYLYISTLCGIKELEKEIVLLELDQDFNLVKEHSPQTRLSFETPVYKFDIETAGTYWVNQLVRRVGKMEMDDVMVRANNLLNNTPNSLKRYLRLTYLRYSNKLLIDGLDLDQKPFYMIEGNDTRFVLDGSYYRFVERPDHVLVGVGVKDIIHVC